MSVDIRYHAFSEGRADKGWKNFFDKDVRSRADLARKKEDLIREKWRLWEEYDAATGMREKFKTREGRYPSDEELHKLNTGNPADYNEVYYVELPPETVDLDKRIKDLGRQIDDMKGVSFDGPEYDLLTLLSSENKEADRATLLNFLKRLDLEYGAVTTWLNEPKWEERFWYVLLTLFAPHAKSLNKEKDYFDINLLNGDDIIACYENIEPSRIMPHLESLDPQGSLKLDVKDASDRRVFFDMLVEFAEQVHPVAFDLKKNGSRFIHECMGGDIDDTGLGGRAENHLKDLIEKYPYLNEKLR